jgi:hypothetical protein
MRLLLRPVPDDYPSLCPCSTNYSSLSPDGNSHDTLPVVLVKGGLPDSDVVVVPGVAPDPVEGGAGGAEEGGAETTGQHHPGRLPHVNLFQLGSSGSSSVS